MDKLYSNAEIKAAIRVARARRDSILPGYSPRYWDAHKYGLDFISQAQWDQAARLYSRHSHYRTYCQEVLPAWKIERTIYWGDNSVEVFEVCKCGQHKRSRLTTPPHGDLCF